MSQTITNQKQKNLSCHRLPLAVYREVAAHLRQVEGVKTQLLPQKAKDFDYLQSQVGGLSVSYPDQLEIETQVNSILTYYENKYGKWETIDDDAL
ncbi:hypothetical protein [Cyanobacterium sp. Dongsha4]|uniref:hypothetical protein n=1 Tax=Cyanobacterium sp. DS4 TaxID=2878255 RepID=UPI002E80276F|nr:hypothetical protein [Cyanobacterium sp. Dongsha4]WVK99322.1 hypothetical protein Dongsha4_11565 [Cyanobacterium sp. Dongsha4]